MIFDYNQKTQIKIGIWNIHLDGLHCDILWTKRKNQIIKILNEMLETCDMVITMENDHFHWILSELQNLQQVKGIYFLDSNQHQTTSKNRDKYLDRIYNKIKGNSNYDNITKCYEFINLYNIDNPDSGIPTFRDEKADELAMLYDFKPEDAYFSDSGIGIYYHKNILPIDFQHCLVYSPENYGVLDFCEKSNPSIEYRLLAINLENTENGNNDNQEILKSAKLNKILKTHTHSKKHHILALSNLSTNLTNDMINPITTCCNILHMYRFKTSLNPNYQNESFYISHPNSKGYVFENLNHVFLDERLIGQQNNYPLSFRKYPLNEMENIIYYRDNPELLEKRLLESPSTENITNKLSNLFNFVRFMYPNPKAPSRHPPLVIEIAHNHRWNFYQLLIFMVNLSLVYLLFSYFDMIEPSSYTFYLIDFHQLWCCFLFYHLIISLIN